MPSSILYLSFDGLLTPLGQSQVLAYAVRLAAMGFKFRFVSLEQPKNLSDSARCRELREMCLESGMEWTPLRYSSSSSIPGFSRAMNLLRMGREASRIVQTQAIDVIH